MTLLPAPTHPDSRPMPRWLHVWAIVTVLATLALLALGAEVTTRGAGMADRNAFSHFHEPLILVRQWQEGSLEESAHGYSVGHYVIEHSHRLAGIVVGICTVILAAGLWFVGRPRWLRWLGLAGLLAVIAQGVLGALRVRLDVEFPQSLRLLHGCSAPLVFGLLACIAVYTSPRWSQPVARFSATQANYLRRLSLGTLVLIYGQIVLGALIRHVQSPLAARLHLVIAFVVVAGIIWWIREWWQAIGLSRGERVAAFSLAGLLLVQVLLGLEAWLGRFLVRDGMTHEPMGPWALPADLARSLHHLVGVLILAQALVITLLIYRRSRVATSSPSNVRALHPELEGVA